MADVVVMVSCVVASARIGEAWASGDTCWGVSWSREFIERSTSEIRMIIDRCCELPEL